MTTETNTIIRINIRLIELLNKYKDINCRALTNAIQLNIIGRNINITDLFAGFIINNVVNNSADDNASIAGISFFE